MRITILEKKFEGLLYEDYYTKKAYLLSWNAAPAVMACKNENFLNPHECV